MIDQALLSAFGFALNLILIRSWEPAVFGAYAVVAFLNGHEARRTVFQAAVENQPPPWPPVPTQD